MGVVTGLALLAAVGCQPGQPSRELVGGWRVGVLTPEQDDRYLVTTEVDAVTLVAPPTNLGSNLRLIGVRTAAPRTLDHESCATWTGPLSTDGELNAIQPGVVLRASVGPTRSRAVVISDNIFGSWRGEWNVHLADSAADPPLVRVDQVHLGTAIAEPVLRETPWRLCGRVAGRDLAVKIWPSEEVDEPSWDDARYTARVTLPPEAVFPGRPGWYLGHLAPGESTSLVEWTGRPLPAEVTPLARPPRPRSFAWWSVGRGS